MNPNWKELRKARAERSLDEQVRRTLGLRWAGLVYVTHDWRVAPYGLYVACDGQEYVRLAAGRYQKRSSWTSSTDLAAFF